MLADASASRSAPTLVVRSGARRRSWRGAQRARPSAARSCAAGRERLLHHARRASWATRLVGQPRHGQPAGRRRLSQPARIAPRVPRPRTGCSPGCGCQVREVAAAEAALARRLRAVPPAPAASRRCGPTSDPPASPVDAPAQVPATADAGPMTVYPAAAPADGAGAGAADRNRRPAEPGRAVAVAQADRCCCCCGSAPGRSALPA